MKKRTLERIAYVFAIVCTGFNLFGVFAMGYAAYHHNWLIALAIFAYLSVASTVEYVVFRRIHSGKLLSGWQYD